MPQNLFPYGKCKVEFSQEEDWVYVEIKRLCKQTAQLRQHEDISIMMSHHLLAELRHNWFCWCPGAAVRNNVNNIENSYFNRIPIIERSSLPIPTKEGNPIHYFIIEDESKKILCHGYERPIGKHRPSDIPMDKYTYTCIITENCRSHKLAGIEFCEMCKPD